MILIIGLGNPGRKFQKTRHNLGFSVLDMLQKEWGFTAWKKRKKLLTDISKGNINNQDVVLAKPQTYMNESGKSVSRLIGHWGLKPTDLIVIHDDFDIPLGEFKISQASSSAGHKGVQSIIDILGTKGFNRFRIGIKPDNTINIDLEEFVLKRFRREQERILTEIKKRISKTLIEYIE